MMKAEGKPRQIKSLQPVVEAETCFQQAVTIARRQSAKFFELGAVMSLAQLWHHQGKTPQAYKLLAEIYNWFTEGFETKALQSAKVLLEKLAP